MFGLNTKYLKFSYACVQHINIFSKGKFMTLLHFNKMNCAKNNDINWLQNYLLIIELSYNKKHSKLHKYVGQLKKFDYIILPSILRNNCGESNDV